MAQLAPLDPIASRKGAVSRQNLQKEIFGFLKRQLHNSICKMGIRCNMYSFMAWNKSPNDSKGLCMAQAPRMPVIMIIA
jgi:hypothetical protein